MTDFFKALVSDKKNETIPDDQDIFGTLIGDWDFDWQDLAGENIERHVKGEWIFSRVLNGTAIQDLFICPSRSERLKNNQPDGEYGTTLRIYNPQTKAWDIFYGCTNEATRLEARRNGNDIVLTEISEKKMTWTFSDITETSFHWIGRTFSDDGTWKVYGKVTATRKLS